MKTAEEIFQVNLKLNETQIAKLDLLVAEGQNRASVAKMLLLAAADAIARAQGRLTWPPVLSVPGVSSTCQETIKNETARRGAK